MMRASTFKLVLFTLVGVAAGCGQQQLYSNLHEREANEMMAVLAKNGITSTKAAGEEEGTWNLSVPGSSFAQAVEALDAQGYPKDEFADMGKVFQKSGLVSSPSEERIRFVFALQQEIAKTLSYIDGVLVPRVQIVLPNNDPFGEEVKPSSAAVFIKHRPDADLEALVPKIKELVIASVEGLGPDNVTVAMFPADESLAGLPPGAADVPALENVMSIQLAPASVMRFWQIIGAMAAVAVLGVAFGVFAWLRARPQLPASGAA